MERFRGSSVVLSRTRMTTDTLSLRRSPLSRPRTYGVTRLTLNGGRSHAKRRRLALTVVSLASPLVSATRWTRPVIRSHRGVDLGYEECRRRKCWFPFEPVFRTSKTSNGRRNTSDIVTDPSLTCAVTRGNPRTGKALLFVLRCATDEDPILGDP